MTVYKVEQYLEQCVDSILAQTFDDFELILVDDGSPDGCAAVCDAYASGDARVRVLHQENKGVANARKSGLRASQGKYIVFIDGDDWVSPSFLWFGHRVMESAHADMALFACSYEYGDFSEKMYEPAEAGLYERASIQERLYPSILMDSAMCHMSYSVFAKVFCRGLAEKCFMEADERISIGEDVLCIVRAYLEAERIYVSREVTNFYRVHRQSASNTFQIGYYRQAALVLENLQKLEMLSYALPEDFGRQMERYGACMCFLLMIHAVEDGQLARLREIKRQIQRPLLKESLKNARFEKISPKTRISLLLLKRNMVVLLYGFLYACRRLKMILGRKKVPG